MADHLRTFSDRMIGMAIRTATYTVSRSELALLGAREYIRSFWWFVIVTPLFGVLAVLFTTGLMQVIGFMAILWPFSIPARSVIATSKSSRLFSGGCSMEANDQDIVFLGPESATKRLRFRIPLATVTSLRESGDLLILRTSRLGFAPVRVTAFDSDQDLR